MGPPIVFYKNLYDTYQKMGLPVEHIDPSTDFTINSLKELHPELPFKFKEFPFLLAETVHPKVLEPEAFVEFEQLYLQILAPGLGRNL